MRLHERLIEIGNLKRYVRIPKYGKCYLEYLLESDYSVAFKEFWARRCIERYADEVDKQRETKNEL